MGDLPTAGAVIAAIFLAWLWLDDGMSTHAFYERLRKDGWSWPLALALAVFGLVSVVLVSSLIGWGPWKLW